MDANSLDFQFSYASIVPNIYLDCFGGEIKVLMKGCKFPGTVSCTMWIYRIVMMVLVLIAVIVMILVEKEAERVG